MLNLIVDTVVKMIGRPNHSFQQLGVKAMDDVYLVLAAHTRFMTYLAV